MRTNIWRSRSPRLSPSADGVRAGRVLECRFRGPRADSFVHLSSKSFRELFRGQAGRRQQLRVTAGMNEMRLPVLSQSIDRRQPVSRNGIAPPKHNLAEVPPDIPVVLLRKTETLAGIVHV